MTVWRWELERNTANFYLPLLAFIFKKILMIQNRLSIRRNIKLLATISKKNRKTNSEGILITYFYLVNSYKKLKWIRRILKRLFVLKT